MILATKLFLPRRRDDQVPRSDLISRLQAGFMRPLTLVTAPAGFAKTTTVATALAGITNAAWLTLDPEDGEPARFWAYVIAALQTVQSHVGRDAQAMLSDPRPLVVADLLTSLINDLAALPPEGRIVLALDDLQQIDHPEIFAQLNFLLDHIPPQLRLVLLTRADPPLLLPRRRARGEVYELRARDLRFQPAEIASFFRIVAGRTLDQNTLSELERRTEGWPAGLQMAALAPEPSLSAGAAAHDRLAMDYLADEVLSQQPAEVQHFLLRTAVLERMCAELCAALLAPDLTVADAAAKLEALDSGNLFVVPLDGHGRWYRYHHLFADLLRLRLERRLPSTELAELHRRVAQWHDAHGDPGEAIAHALAAGDEDLAVAVIARHYQGPLRRLEPYQLKAWLMRLPAQLISQRPALLLVDAWRALFQLDTVLLQERLRQLDALVEQMTLLEQAEARVIANRFALLGRSFTEVIRESRTALAALPAEAYFLRGMATLNLGLAQRLNDELAAAAETVAAAAALGRAADDTLTVLTAELSLANIRQVQGDVVGAEVLMRQAMARAADPAGTPLPLADLVLNVLGRLRYELNDLAEAVALIDQGLNLARRRRSDRGILDGTTFLMLAAQAQGDNAQASAAAAEAAAFAARIGSPLISAIVAERRARRDLFRGDTAAAVHWAAAINLDAPMDELQEQNLLTVVWAGLTSDAANLDRSDRALAHLQSLNAAHPRFERTLRVTILAALRHALTMNRSAAAADLHAALQLAAPTGLVRTFVDYGPVMRGLLADLDPQTLMPAADHYRRQLLAAFSNTTAPQVQLLAEPLSDREREVLQALAAGLSNAAIAEQLVVAPTTVKAHLRNIFAKLEVGSRTQAIARARSLGLIE